MSDMGLGGDYGYGINEYLKYLMPAMSGDPKGDKANLDFQAKGVNNFQDMLQLMMSPQFAMMSGSYDPALMTPAAPKVVAPFQENWTSTTSYANSPNERVAFVASGMQSGQMDGLTARQTLTQAMIDGQLPNITPEQIEAVVSSIEKEAADNVTRYQQYESDVMVAEQEAANAPRTDEFVQYGLPSPNEQYTAETLPMDSSFYQGRDQARSAADLAARNVDSAKLNRTRSNAIEAGPRRQTADRMEQPAMAALGTNAAEMEAYRSYNQENSEYQAATQQVEAALQRIGAERALAEAEGRPGRYSQEDRELTWKTNEPQKPGGSNPFGDLFATRILLDKWAREGAPTAKAEPTVDKKKKEPSKGDLAVTEAISRSVTARNKAEGYDGQAMGAASAANFQGRSPIRDAMMQRFMQMTQSGIGG